MRERSYSVCVFLTAGIVQITKHLPFICKLPTQVYSILISFCVLFLLTFLPPLKGDYQHVRSRWQRILVFIIDAVIFSFSSNGLYDLLKMVLT